MSKKLKNRKCKLCLKDSGRKVTEGAPIEWETREIPALGGRYIAWFCTDHGKCEIKRKVEEIKQGFSKIAREVEEA